MKHERAQAGSLYHRLVSEAKTAVYGDEIDLSRSLFLESQKVADSIGCQQLIETAICNRCAAEIELGCWESTASLRHLVSTTRYSQVRMLAAYDLAAAYHDAGQVAKATFYAQIAYQIAQNAGGRHRAHCAYQLGLLMVARYRLEEARALLEEALALGFGDGEARSMATSTLGYCRGLEGSTRTALSLLDDGIRDLEKARCWGYLRSARLNKGFVLLELGNAEAAGDLADRVLESNCLTGSDRKYALFLAGEAAASRADSEAAAEHFRCLQGEYYPGAEGLIDQLLGVRTSSLINWLA